MLVVAAKLMTCIQALRQVVLCDLCPWQCWRLIDSTAVKYSNMALLVANGRQHHAAQRTALNIKAVEDCRK